MRYSTGILAVIAVISGTLSWATDRAPLSSSNTPPAIATTTNMGTGTHINSVSTNGIKPPDRSFGKSGTFGTGSTGNGTGTGGDSGTSAGGGTGPATGTGGTTAPESTRTSPKS